MDIGLRIKELRDAAGLSSRQLAKLSSLSPSYLHDVENNNSNPTIDKLSKICEALNITLIQFFSKEEDLIPTVITPEIRTLMENAKNLSAQQIESLSYFIETLHPDHKYGEKNIDGITHRYTIDTNRKPNGLSPEEEQEAEELMRRLGEIYRDQK